MVEKVEVLVEGGSATPGPPLGPSLGPLGVNIVEVVNAINRETKEFAGMKVPVKILVDTSTKKFELVVGVPPASSLILKELGIEKGSSKKEDVIGNLTMQQVVKITNLKKELLGKDLRKAVKEIVGTCGSMGVTIEGKNAKEILKDIDAGFYNDILYPKQSNGTK
jgi:large subunit ribosomal protein L11